MGDIFISLEMALEQSYEYKHSIYREMIWLASHGFLHLLGWEHNNEHDLENETKVEAPVVCPLCHITVNNRYALSIHQVSCHPAVM